MSNISKFSWVDAIIMFFNLVCVHVGLFLACLILEDIGSLGDHVEKYGYNLIGASAAAFAIFYLYGICNVGKGRRLQSIIVSVFLSIFTYTAGSLLISVCFDVLNWSAAVYFMAFIFQFGLITLILYLISSIHKHLFSNKKVLIIGETMQDGRILEHKIQNLVNGSVEIVGYLHETDWQKNKHVLDSSDVVLVQSNFTGKDELMSYCALKGKEVLVIPEVSDLLTLNADMQQIDDLLVLSVKPPKLNQAERLIKRLFDIVVSLILLVILSPVLLVIYLSVSFTSPGSAIFKQVRSGLNGTEFEIIKFRTMIDNAESISGPMLATTKDPRITKIGAILRATRLDELPQFLNVLKGDMSLIGPRPERPFFVEQFMQTIPTYSYRMTVKPGITGLAQVMGKYNTTALDKHRFDLMYLRQYSLLLDLKISFQTILIVLSKEQAEGVKVTNTIPNLQESANNI
ncbi:sugar transferase [Paenibacillus albiflavus]|uniref:Sugar transferase n=1 Tax=Paenibacillus albiflavus TaxID=2545760 RepID=A0A4R4EE76_9BACL|nr:sugar transferase [Paenibacillus albiflavus]TCZ77523.1 sugar transferase [Paenibacillus albiflavus]